VLLQAGNRLSRAALRVAYSGGLSLAQVCERFAPGQPQSVRDAFAVEDKKIKTLLFFLCEVLKE